MTGIESSCRKIAGVCCERIWKVTISSEFESAISGTLAFHFLGDENSVFKYWHRTHFLLLFLHSGNRILAWNVDEKIEFEADVSRHAETSCTRKRETKLIYPRTVASNWNVANDTGMYNFGRRNKSCFNVYDTTDKVTLGQRIVS